MAKKRIEEPTAAEDQVSTAEATTPDGKASVILREGPFDGAHDVLPTGAVVHGNEIHVPSREHKCVAIYHLTESEGDLPTYRLARKEPTY